MEWKWFWRGLACASLVAALGIAVMHFTSARPVQAQAGSVIAVTAAENGLHRLFLIDTTRSVILVYGGTSQYMFTLLAGRWYDADAQATVKTEWRFNQRGYPITQMDKYLKSKTRKH